MWKQMTMVVLLSGLVIFRGVGRSYAQAPTPSSSHPSVGSKPPTDDGTPLFPLAPTPMLGGEGVDGILGICDGLGDYPFDPDADPLYT